MKKMAVAMVLFLLPIVMKAQSAEERVSRFVNNMQHHLALTDEAKHKLYNFTLERVRELESLKGSEVKEKQQQFLMQRRKYHTEVKAFLTEEQIKKWHDLQRKNNGLKKEGKIVPQEDAVMVDILELN